MFGTDYDHHYRAVDLLKQMSLAEIMKKYSQGKVLFLVTGAWEKRSRKRGGGFATQYLKDVSLTDFEDPTKTTKYPLVMSRGAIHVLESLSIRISNQVINKDI